MQRAEALLAAARLILPREVALAAADPFRAGGLLPGEVCPGIPARQAEFAAGRRAARAAMVQIGATPGAIPMGPDRAPCWPPGVIGSISQGGAACLAAVTRAGSLAALGIDIEPDEDLPPDLWTEVLSPSEAEWCELQPRPGRAARLIFSAKEAAFKAQYPLSRQMFGFDAMNITITADYLRAIFAHPAAPFAAGDRISGRFVRTQGLILTAIWL